MAVSKLARRAARASRLLLIAQLTGCHSTRLVEFYQPVKFEDDRIHIREATKKSKKIANVGIRTCGFGNVVHPCGRAL